jgi:hypothetical protein
MPVKVGDVEGGQLLMQAQDFDWLTLHDGTGADMSNAKTEMVDCKFKIFEGANGPFLEIILLGDTPLMLEGVHLSLHFRNKPDFEQAQEIADEMNKTISRLSVLTFTSLDDLKQGLK